MDLFGDSARRLLSIALPVGLTNAIPPAVNAVIVTLLAGSGAAAVAAFGVVTRIEAFAFVILMGVAIAMGPIVGQNFGAGKFDRVHDTIRLAMRFNIGWSLFIAIVLGLLAEPVAGLFSDDENVIRYAMLFFWIVPFSYAFSNIVNGWASAFNAMGMPRRSFVMIVVKMLALMIPAVWIGHKLGGVNGLFCAMATVNLVTGTVFHLWGWRTCKLREEKALAEQAV